MDIFENTILCKKCSKAMKPVLISKNGFNLRALKCDKCGEVIVHPVDKAEYENFIRLKQKDYAVKMRMVGNSYAVSIPREIVDFMKEQEKMMNNMVRLSFEEAGRISLMFHTPEIKEQEGNEEGKHSRFIGAKEIRIVRNGKPVLHAKKIVDSANPKNNKSFVYKAKELNKDEEIEEEE